MRKIHYAILARLISETLARMRQTGTDTAPVENLARAFTWRVGLGPDFLRACGID